MNGQKLQVVDKFTYLGSTLSRAVHIDDEVTTRTAKASVAFGRLRTNVWEQNGAQWLVKFNATKTDYIIITRKRNRPNHPNLILNGETISESQNHTHLGVTLNNKLSWSVHINMAIAKADRRLSVIRRCRNQIPRPCRETLYKTIIRPVLDYGDIIYDSCLKSESDVLEKFQRKCALVCSGAFKITSHEKLLK